MSLENQPKSFPRREITGERRVKGVEKSEQWRKGRGAGGSGCGERAVGRRYRVGTASQDGRTFPLGNPEPVFVRSPESRDRRSGGIVRSEHQTVKGKMNIRRGDPGVSHG